MRIDKVIINQNFSSKEEVLEFISMQMAQLEAVNRAEDFLEALYRREAEGVTGLIDGFAIPHGKDIKIRDAAVVYVRNNRGLDWETLDDSKVTDIFALAIPQNGSDEHLDNLIAISTSLMDEELCARLRAAATEAEILELFV